jgi:hypothetical protein
LAGKSAPVREANCTDPRRGRWWPSLVVVSVLVITLALTWFFLERDAARNIPIDLPYTSPSPQSSTPTATIEVDRSILTDDPCAPPCWQGVVPGNTMTKEEVIELLETLPNVGSIWESYPGGIDWVWRQWPWEGTGYNGVDLAESRVHNISLSIAFELTVEEILDKYGPPDATNAVLAGVHRNYIGMSLLYPTQGLWLKARLSDYRPVLDPTTRIYMAHYLIPADSLESWLGPDMAYMQLQPWPGYGEIDVEAYGLRDP